MDALIANLNELNRAVETFVVSVVSDERRDARDVDDDEHESTIVAAAPPPMNAAIAQTGA